MTETRHGDFVSRAGYVIQITGIYVTLTDEFATIMQALSSGFEIDNEAFELKAFNTAKLFVKLYTWYPMPASVLKILIIGPLILENALLPISQHSEGFHLVRRRDFRQKT